MKRTRKRHLFVSLRWHVILSAEVPSPGVSRLLKITFVGLFFNQVLTPFAPGAAASSA